VLKNLVLSGFTDIEIVSDSGMWFLMYK